MFLSVQQKYIMEILRKLGYIRREQLRTLVQGRFSELEISECRMAAMLRQLRYATGDVHLDNSAVWLGEAQPDFQRLEAVDVMLELSEVGLLVSMSFSSRRLVSVSSSSILPV